MSDPSTGWILAEFARRGWTPEPVGRAETIRTATRAAEAALPPDARHRGEGYLEPTRHHAHAVSRNAHRNRRRP